MTRMLRFSTSSEKTEKVGNLARPPGSGAGQVDVDFMLHESVSPSK